MPIGERNNGDASGSTPRLSIKEQIALKRAAALKSSTSSLKGPISDRPISDDEDDLLNQTFSSLHTTKGPHAKPTKTHPLDSFSNQPEQPDAFNRDPDEIIYRGASSGRINLSYLSLSRLPPSLYTLLLGLTPTELSRPPTPPSQLFPASPARSVSTTPKKNAFGQEERKERKLAYYEIVDLLQLKAAGNRLMEVESELGLFGGLKVLDLRENELEHLPETVGDLKELAVLDISNNRFTHIPKSTLLLPSLHDLNISSNLLASVSFSSPTGPTAASAEFGSSMFSAGSAKRRGAQQQKHQILPGLRTFRLAGNKIARLELEDGGDWPSGIQTLDLSSNSLSGELDASALSSAPLIKILMLGNNALTSVSSVQGELKDLEEVDLEGNKVEQLDWVKEGLGRGRSWGWRGENEWGGVVTGGDKDGDGVLVFNLTRNPLAASTLKPGSKPPNASKASRTTDDEPIEASSSMFTRPHARHLKLPAEKTQWEVEAEGERNIEGGQRFTRAVAARAGQTSSKDTEDEGTNETRPSGVSEMLKECLNARKGELEISTAIGRGLLSPSGELDLGEILAELGEVKIGTITVHPLPGLKSLALGIGTWPTVTALSILYTSLLSTPSLFPSLAAAFPNLQTLDLSGSRLMNLDGLGKLLEGGLKVLKVKDGKIEGLGALEEVAKSGEGRELREVDVRDNGIEKLNPILGTLPLTSFLVDNNAFRIPNRRVWEKEGTKGLLTWLRDRIE